MDKPKKNTKTVRKGFNYRLFVPIIIFVLVLSSILDFVIAVRKNTEKNTQASLNTIMEYQTKSIEKQIDSSFKGLASFSDFIKEYSAARDQTEIVFNLNALKEGFDFIEIQLIYPDGSSINDSNETTGTHIQEALNMCLKDKPRTIYYNEAANGLSGTVDLVYAIYKDDGNIHSYLYAKCSNEEMGKLLVKSEKDKSINFFLIDLQGHPIAISQTFGTEIQGSFFEFLESDEIKASIDTSLIKEDIKNKKSDTFTFTYKENNRKYTCYASYAPIEIEGTTWYLLTISNGLYNTELSINIAMFCIILLAKIIIASIIFSFFLSRHTKDKVKLETEIVKANDMVKSKSEFLSRMSHEIRTPMNGIIGMLAIIRKNIDDPIKIRDCLNKLEQSSQMLSQIINDVLDMSSLDNNEVKLNKVPFDFKQLLTTLVDIFVDQSKADNISFDVQLVNITEEVISGDSLRLNQILIYVLANAFRFTKENGSISFIIEQQKVENGKVYLQFTIKDNGIGFSNEKVKRIFTPFDSTQIEVLKEKKENYEMGLSLAVVKKLVELMDGTINVVSEENVETVYTINISFTEIGQSSPVPGLSFEKTKVLIVDDDVNESEAIALTLDRLHVKYEKASQNYEVVNLLERHRDFNMCLLNWDTQGDEYEEIIKTIRKKYDKNKLSIVVMTYTLDTVPNNIISLVNKLVPRPIFQSTVFDVLLEHTGGYKLEEDNEESYDFSNNRCLLVEDNRINIEIASETLRDAKIEVEVAKNGVEAIRMFKSHPDYYYDFVLMDIQMPLMDGYAATRNIRAVESNYAKELPIIAMTANAFKEDIEKSIEAGMNEHLSKPVQVKKLFTTLDKYIKRK